MRWKEGINMYDILWSIIQSGDFNLPDITYKIDVFYAEGKINDDQRTDLLEQITEHADPERERPEVPEQIEYVLGLIEALTDRVIALEQGNTPTEDESYSSIEEWKQPIAGLTDKYQFGAIVTHIGKVWESTFRGQNIWEPGVLGTGLVWKEKSE